MTLVHLLLSAIAGALASASVAAALDGDDQESFIAPTMLRLA
jgi:hypothetical protein